MYNHQTAQCPHCGKDSWESLYKAIFVPVQCTHCKEYLMYDPGKDCSVKTDKKGKK